MKTKDIMTAPVVSVTPDTSVPDVARLLLERHISAVPVIEPGGRLVGMVSEGDFLRRAEGDSRRHGSWWLRLLSGPGDSAADYVKTHGRFAADMMTRDVITVTGDTPIGETAGLLEKRRIKRVPVLRDGTVVGIVSRADILRGLAARPDIVAAPLSAADETIRRQILDEIRAGGLAPTYGLTVMVADGLVQIWGLVDAPEQGEALRVAAENVPGVKGVELNVTRIPAYAWGQ